MNIRIRRALVPTVALGLVLAAQPAYASVSSTPDVTGQAVGGVYAIADAGDRTIIGGLFTRYGNRARSNVAAINADGSVDTAWNPGTNGVVKAVAVSEDGTTVFLGGIFTTVGGQARANLAAVDAVTGVVRDTWVANTGGTDPRRQLARRQGRPALRRRAVRQHRRHHAQAAGRARRRQW